LKAENQRLNTNLAESAALGRNLQQSGRDKDAENLKLTKQLERMTGQCNKFQNDYEGTYRELQAMKQDKADLDRQLTSEKQRADDAELKTQDVQGTLDQVTAELADRKRELQALQTDNRNQAAEINGNKQLLQSHAKQIAKSERELADLRAKLEQSESEVDRLTTVKAESDTSISNLQSELKKANSTASKLKRQLSDSQTLASKQATELESTKEARDRAQMQLADSQKRETKLQADLKSIKKQLSDANVEIQTLSDKDRDLSEQLTATTEKVRELSNQSKSLAKSLEEQKSRFKEQSDQLERKLTKTEQRVREVESINSQQAAAIAAREDTVHSLEKRVQELDRIAQKVQQQSDTIARLTQFQESIQSLLPGSKLADIPRAVEKALQGSELASLLLGKLSATGREDALGKIALLKTQSEQLSKIQSILPVSDDLAGAIKSLTEEHRRLRAEHSRISALLAPDGGPDAARAIEDIIERQRAMSGQINSAADFVSQVLAILSGHASSPPARLVFPLKKSIESKLSAVVSSFKARADRDRAQVEDLLVRAHVLGYEGDSVIDACEYITERRLEGERQSTLATVGRELGDVRVISESEKEAYERDKARSREKLAKMAESLTRQMETQREREEAFGNEKAELLRQIRELRADLETEHRVREELGRIGAGLSSDKGYLRSKLSKNELRLLDFAERMAESDRAAAELHEKQRRDREALIGSTLSKSQNG
jgi:chromosome segregation ATPase